MSKRFLSMERDANRRARGKAKGGVETDVRLRVTEWTGTRRSRGLRFWFGGILWRERW